jgi:hypothetical protein
MPLIEFIEYKGKKILRADINGCGVEKFEDLFIELGELLKKEPPESVLSLAVCGPETPIFTNKEFLIKLLQNNGPYIKFAAISGFDRLRTGIYSSVISASGRNVMLFPTEKEAIEWLVSRK